MIEKDYRFLDAEGRNLGLTDLFGPHDTLVTFFWMFGPQRARPCPMCTNMLGPWDANAADIAQKASLKVFSRSPVSRMLDFARERGWTHLEFLQTVGDDYARDVGALSPDGSEMGAGVVFRKDAGGKVRLFWGCEIRLRDGRSRPGSARRGRDDGPAMAGARPDSRRPRPRLVPEAQLLNRHTQAASGAGASAPAACMSACSASGLQS